MLLTVSIMSRLPNNLRLTLKKKNTSKIFCNSKYSGRSGSRGPCLSTGHVNVYVGPHKIFQILLRNTCLILYNMLHTHTHVDMAY